MLWFAAASCPAAEVLRVGASQKIIAISHDSNRPFVENDSICIFQKGREVACGTVVKSSAKGAIVRLESKSGDLLRGDIVRLEASGRKPAMQIFDSLEADENAKNYDFNLSGGISAGLNFFFPNLNLQKGVTPKFSLGLVPFYFNFTSNDTSVGAYGGYFTFNYYQSDYFRGLWVQLGPGLYFFNAKTGEVSESAKSFAAMATVGWRGYWDLGLNIGVGAGVQYVREPDIRSVEVRSSNFQPLVILDLGFNF